MKTTHHELPRTQENIAAFLRDVEKTDACWLWKGNRFKEGYGRFHIGNRVYIRTNRAAWMLFRGRIPEGLFICHHCDNPQCVNPDHLFLGTAADNRHDQDAKLRHFRGESVNTNKLTEEQVREIRARFANGETNRSALAREYGVSNPLVGLIVRGKCWKHIL